MDAHKLSRRRVLKGAAAFADRRTGQPVEAVIATEGVPLITVPSGIFASAPNPNAARLFQSFLFSAEAQQIFVDTYAQRSFHALVREKPGRTPLSRSSF